MESNSVEAIEDEVNTICKIIEQLCSTTFDESYTIQNDGTSYELGNDSKIISKIYEIILVKKLKSLLDASEFHYIENNVQNKYPDFIIVSKLQKEKFYAVDIKSTYLKTRKMINGFTLGTYKGYFKNRDSLKTIVKPYNNFLKHFCVGVIYDRVLDKTPVKHVLVREKWQIASSTTGSGNTCNIGSIKLLDDLINSKSYFENEEAFNKYWLEYKC